MEFVLLAALAAAEPFINCGSASYPASRFLAILLGRLGALTSPRGFGGGSRLDAGRRRLVASFPSVGPSVALARRICRLLAAA